MKTLIFSLFTLFPLCLSAQVDTVWAERWTSPGAMSDWGYAIAVDDSGNTYVTGKTENAETNDDWTTIKYTPAGDTAWVRYFASAGTPNERASSIVVNPGGSIYVTGYTMGSNAGDYLTIKYRFNGDTAWTRRYNGTGSSYDFSHSVGADAEDNSYVTGYSRGASYQDDIATVKYDSSGSQVWVARFNGAGNYNDKGHKVIADNNGNVYVTGYVNPNATGTLYDYATIKYDALTGDTQWVRIYNGPADSSDLARDIVVDAWGNVYVTGSSRGVGTSTDILTIKYDASGTQKWLARYDNPDTSGSDGGYGIRADQAGNVYVAGQSQGLGTGTDIVVIKYDSAGAEKWVARYDGPAHDYDVTSDEVGGKCLAIDLSANVYVAGTSRGITTYNDYVTVMYDSAGNEKWAARCDFSDSLDYGLAVAVDTGGGVSVTGRTISGASYYDIGSVKYRSTGVGITGTGRFLNRAPSLQIHPNPFRGHAAIAYSLACRDKATVSIYDVSGRIVKRVVNEYHEPGTYSTTWNGKDRKDHKVAPGVYFCILEAGKDAAQKKLIFSP